MVVEPTVFDLVADSIAIANFFFHRIILIIIDKWKVIFEYLKLAEQLELFDAKLLL